MITANIPLQHDTEGRAHSKGSPPYMPYLTFRHFLQWLDAEGIPLRFDRTAWEKKYSGSTGSQLLTGLRFLGLLDGELPTPELETIIEAKGADRDELLRKRIIDTYSPEVNFSALPRATTGMLDEWIKSYGIEGDTARKAASFFVNASKDLNIPISMALRKLARNRPQGPSKRTAVFGRSGPKEQQPPRATEAPVHTANQPPTPRVDTAAAQESLILWGLFKRLPAPGSEFTRSDRETWLEAAKTLFNLEYKDGEEE